SLSFDYSLGPRALPSFPTRRSSDLPTGARRCLQSALIFVADWLPLVAFAAMGVILLWQYTMEVPRVEFHLWDLAKLAAAPLLVRSEEHTSELQSLTNLVCRLLLEKK